ncbi:MAG TPA: oligosaccharide flippase family protein [Myxococcota bacterium]|nr:oligosaccharide flippase family protein [Myxococcota bacterium]HRY93989.1 oligosaccharide flippase family protein [Myxococcota bacterium]HSA24204.1 oligosaccharide flippase family protein [Myxococcota bacterium]
MSEPSGETPSPSPPARSPAEVRRGDIRHAAVGAGTNFLTIIAGLSEFAFQPIMAHLYGVSTYGLYRFGYGILEPFLRLSALGTDKGLLRHIASHRVAGEPELERASLRTACWLTLLGGLGLAALAFLLAGPLARLQNQPSSELAIRLLAPSIPFAALVLVLISATMGAKLMRYNLLVRGIAQPLLLLLAALAAGLLSPTLVGLCGANVVATALTALLAVWAARRVFRGVPLRELFWPRSGRGPGLHWEMARFSLPMGLAEFLNAVLQRADLILLGFFAGLESVGVYAGLETISRIVANVRYAFDPVASPVLSEALRQRDQARLGYNLKLMTRWVALLTFPVFCFMLLFQADLLGLFPREFLVAAGLFPLFLLRHLVNGTLGLSGWVVAMAGRSSLVLFNNLAAAACNVGLSLWLLPRHGMLGACIAALASVSLIQVLILVEVVVLHRVQPFSLAFLKVCLAAAAALGVMHQLAPLEGLAAPLRLGLGTLLLVGLYLGALVALRLQPEEREIAARVGARLGRLLGRGRR